MRIVAVADTHLFHDELAVPEGDVFVHAGDLCRRGTLEELQLAAEWLCALPHSVKIVVAGNHDWAFARSRESALALLGPEVTYLEDSGATIAGLRFWGSPWQPAYNGWAFNLARGEPLRERWARIPTGTDVLVTHGPPRGIGDGEPSGYASGRWGCEELLARVEVLKPALHLFGHIHDAGGTWSKNGTVFANVTTWECERSPTVLDLDPSTRTVTPFHVPPARRGNEG